MRARGLTFISFVALSTVAVAQDGPAPIFVAPTVPPAFRLLDEPAVQKDIGLTDAQKTAAEQIRLSWPLAANGLRLGWVGYVPPDVMRTAIDQRTTDFLAKDLTKEQRTRLDQILFQLREKEFGAHQAFAMAARDLRLRPDQMEDVRTLKALRVEEIAGEVTSGKRFAKVKAEVQATNGDTYEKMAEMLSRAQRERFKEMRGRPFEGKVELTNPPPITKPVVAYPPELFGVYDLEVRYLGTRAVRTELKVTGDQAGKLDSALDEWSKAHLALPGLDLNRAGKLHDMTAKALEILTKEQRRRFDQIMIQRRAKAGPEAMCGHPAAVAALKLSPIQLQQLRDGRSAADVLSQDQQAALKTLPGEQFNLPGDVVDPFLALRPRPEPVSAPPVAQARDFLRLTDRLKLTAEQVKKLRELAEDEPRVRDLIQKELSLDDTPPVAGAGRGLTAMNVVTEHYRAAVEQQCWDVLEPGQQSMARKIFGRVAK